MNETEAQPPCFGHPTVGMPCFKCGARQACFAVNATRPAFLLPMALKAPRAKAEGARLVNDEECEYCGPTQGLRLRGAIVCGKCFEPLRSL